MCCVESEEEQIAEDRLRVRESGAIRVVNESKAAFAHLFFESRGDVAQSGRVDLIKRPAGSAQFVNRAEKTVGIPRDRFRDEHGFIVAVFAGELFGGAGEKETKMFA